MGRDYICTINCKPLKFVQFISLFIVLVGCLNEPDCVITTSNLTKISFVKGKDARSITFDQILVSGLNTVYYQNANVSSVQLPVNPAATEITFTFTFEGRTETLKLGYKTSTEVISDTCGAFTNYGNLEIIETTFTDLEIVTEELSINATVNVKISVD